MTSDIKHGEGRINGQAGLNIYWQVWQAPVAQSAPGPTIVIAHGLGEHGGRYRRVAEFLVGRGCVVYAIDHRGHGRSAGPRAFVDRFDHAVADLDQLIDLARRERPGPKLFLLGHSMGGSLALDYAIKHQEKIDALLLSGPGAALTAASAFVVLMSKLLSFLAPSLGVLAIDPSAVSRDPVEVAAYVSDPLNFHGKVPARTAGELVSFIERLPDRLATLTLPLLIMHGKADTLTDVAGSEMVMRGVRSKDKTLLVYEGLRHEIFNELPVDRARVFDDLWTWIDAHREVAATA